MLEFIVDSKLPEIPEENQSLQVKLLLGYVDELVNTIALLKEKEKAKVAAPNKLNVLIYDCLSPKDEKRFKI